MRVRFTALALALALVTVNWGQVAFAAKTISVSGVATNANGTALAKGTVALVDNGGNISIPATTSKSGKFKIKVTGFTLPFLLQSMPAGGGSPIFYGFVTGTGSVASSAVANVDVYTDLLLNLILNAAGTTTAAEFGSRTGLPTSNQVQSIAPITQNLIAHWLVADKVSSKGFSFAGLKFSAGKSKFGLILTQTAINSAFASGSETLVISDAKSQTTQTIIFTSDVPPPLSGFAPFKAQSTTVVNSITTASVNPTASIPVSPTAAGALDGPNALLANLQTTSNLKGAKLADTDLVPFFDPTYLRGGVTASQAAASLVTTLRKMKMSGATVNAVNWTATDTADSTQTDVNAAWGYSLNGVSQPAVNEIFRCDASNTCLFYGNQQGGQTPGAIQLQQLTTSDLATGSTPTIQTSLAVNVTAPQGSLKSVSVSDHDGTHTYYGDTAAPFLDVLIEKTFPTAGNEVDISQDQFFLGGPAVGGTSSLAIPPPGTVFDVTLTDQTDKETTYTSLVDGAPGEAVNLVSPLFTADHSIGAAPIGKAVTFKWKLPTSYVTNTVSLTGLVQNAGCTSSLSFGTAATLPATATSGKITIPKQIASPADIAQVTVNLTIRGLSGETGRLIYVWGHC